MSEAATDGKLFSIDHLRANLKGRSVRGGAMMLSSQAAVFVLNLGSLAVLARLLAPADFGLVAMVTTIIGFVTMFKDAGLAMATVQREHITPEQVSTLFWINVAISSTVMLLVAILAPATAWFYGEPRLTWITLALSGTFLLGGLTVQHQALLTRQMRFGALAVISVVAITAGIAAAIIAALLGLGYWALVIQIAATATVNVLGVWIASDWRPGRPVRGSGIRPMLAFGGNLTAFNVVNYLARNADNVLIGWYWGAGPLGFYTKAYQLLLLPISQINAPISSVALPALSRLQDQPERFKQYYLKGVGTLTFVGMPLVAFLFVDVRDVVLLVLGHTWLPAVPVFRALGIAAFLGTFNVAGGWAYTALDRTARQLRWQIMATPVVVASFLLGLPWGAVGVALAYSVAQLLLWPLSLWYCYQGTFLRLRDLVRTLSRPACISILAAVALSLIARTVLPLPKALVPRLLIEGLIYLSVYLLGWVATKGSRRELASIVRLIRSLRPRNRTPIASPTAAGITP